ncbi:MAG: ATP-dependent Clp protease adapter ClpS [Pseudomonadota bacterium]
MNKQNHKKNNIKDKRDIKVLVKEKTKIKKPSLYQVVMLNDDYTPMEFVVYLLQHFFDKSIEEATQIMLHIHQHGKGKCGVYSFEIAETKVMQVLNLAQSEQHPLECKIEKI